MVYWTRQDEQELILALYDVRKRKLGFSWAFLKERLGDRFSIDAIRSHVNCIGRSAPPHYIRVVVIQRPSISVAVLQRSSTGAAVPPRSSTVVVFRRPRTRIVIRYRYRPKIVLKFRGRRQA